MINFIFNFVKKLLSSVLYRVGKVHRLFLCVCNTQHSVTFPLFHGKNIALDCKAIILPCSSNQPKEKERAMYSVACCIRTKKSGLLLTPCNRNVELGCS